jgi:uroporphyrinogen decarboxylase
MNSRERFLAAARRQPVDRTPAWMMRQAGRSLPEYRELRSGHTFMEMCHRPELAAEATLQPIRRFGMDAAVIFCDILVPAEAMGLAVSIEEGVGPLLDPPVRTAEAVEALRDFDAREATGFLAEALRLVRAELGEERAMLGFCGAPFTLASYMVEGRSSRNYETTKAMMLGQPELFDRLVERIVDNSLGYLAMQVEAGADAIQIFDSWGGSLDAATWRARMQGPITRMVQATRDLGVPVILYVNGCSHLIEAMVETGADVLSIDWRVDPADAVRRTEGRVALQGNMDPVALFAPPDAVRREAQRTLASFEGAPGHIFNLGSGILPKTPLESTTALWDTVLPDRG